VITLKDYVVLSNGLQMPIVGFGTWQIKDGIEVANAVKDALLSGYRHIDTAAIYGNETGVGEGIRASGIRRSDIFLTTKVWNSDQGYDSTIAAFSESLRKLGTDYVDLYLIHWPAVNLFSDYKTMNKETWRAMEKLYREGKAKAIGVCNFLPHHLDDLLESAQIIPMVDQIELHPGNPADDVVSYCKNRHIQVQAYSPMMRGKVFDIPLLQDLAAKYHRTIPQIVLRWIIQKGIVPLTKSVTPERIKSNIQLFDFKIDEADMNAIKSLSTIGRLGTHPDKAKF
jgi:diketogulonate reductase-like aldo/keto reductase